MHIRRVVDYLYGYCGNRRSEATIPRLEKKYSSTPSYANAPHAARPSDLGSDPEVPRKGNSKLITYSTSPTPAGGSNKICRANVLGISK